MNDDIRKLEKIIINMRPSGIIQTQIVDAFKAILWILKKLIVPIESAKLNEVINQIKEK